MRYSPGHGGGHRLFGGVQCRRCLRERSEPPGIGEASESDAGADAAALYEKLEHVAAMFYRQPEAFARVRRCAIALNGSFFNTQRMLVQYAMNAYAPTLPTAW